MAKGFKKKNRNMGRVKRYNRSFYRGRGFLLKKVLGGVLLAAALFAVGFWAAPSVLDWGTHTWYTSIRGRDLDAASSQAADEPDSAADSVSAEQPAPTATPTPAQEVTDGSWAVLSLSALSSPEGIRQTAADLKAQGVAYALVPLKDASGYIYYQSTVASAASGIAATTVDAGLVAEALTAQGIVPVAYLCAFRDPVSVYADRSMAIHYAGSDYLWLDASADAGGKPWMNPYSDTALQFIGDLIGEVADLGYRQVVLSAVQFPAYVSEKQDFGDTAGLDRAGILRQDAAALAQRFEGRVVLWYEVPYASCVTPSTTLGSVTPDALGMENLMILAPASDPETDAASSAGGTPTLEDAARAMLAGGCSHVALRQGSTITLAE